MFWRYRQAGIWREKRDQCYDICRGRNREVLQESCTCACSWTGWEMVTTGKASFTIRCMNLKTLLYFLRLGLPSTLIQTENGAFENAFRIGGICFVVWTENILKAELFASDDITIITWFPWPSFRQPQIQNYWWLLRFQISWAYCGRKTLIRFQSETSVFKFFWR